MSHQINIEALGEAILRRREQQGLTVRAAAEALENVSPSTLSRIERGSLPDIDTYMRLCQWLHVSPAHFAVAPAHASASPRESPLSKEQIIVHLRADKLLNQPTREALITMIEVAYAAARRNLLPNEAQSASGVPDPC